MSIEVSHSSSMSSRREGGDITVMLQDLLASQQLVMTRLDRLFEQNKQVIRRLEGKSGEEEEVRRGDIENNVVIQNLEDKTSRVSTTSSLCREDEEKAVMLEMAGGNDDKRLKMRREDKEKIASLEKTLVCKELEIEEVLGRVQELEQYVRSKACFSPEPLQPKDDKVLSFVFNLI